MVSTKKIVVLSETYFHKTLMYIFVLIKIIWKNSYSDLDKGFICLSVYVWYDH